MRFLVHLLGLVLLSLPPLYAQQPPVPIACGAFTSPASVQLMDSLQNDYLAYAAAYESGSPNSTVDAVPVQVHIIRRSDGTGGLTEAQFDAAFTEVNDFFINASMEFFQCSPINFVDSDTYFNLSTAEETNFWNTYGVSDVLNIIIPGGNLTTATGGGLCGYAYLPGGGRDLIAVARNCMLSGGHTFAHEIGHYFGLYHTHGKVNCGGLTDELVDGSNCATAGDDVCDTPADPGLLGIGCSGYLVSNCVYTGSFTDNNGQPYQPDVSNIMSYAPHSCRNTFSAGQYARLSFYNTNTRGYLSCGNTLSVGSTCVEAQPISNNGNYFPDGPGTGGGCENCSGGAQHADWFYYDAPANGTISVGSCLGNVNTRLWVYTGSCGNLVQVASSDDDCALTPGGPNTASEITLNVSAGTRYYFEWDDRWSDDDFSFSFAFTNPCNPPGAVQTVSSGYSHITQDWESLPGAQGYNVRYRPVASAPWTLEENLTDSEHTLENLSPCTTQEWQVQSICNGTPSAWSNTYSISTAGCSDAYCYSYGNSSTAWITMVSMSNLSNTSGNGNGYSNFTSETATVTQGQSYTLVMDSDDTFTAPVYWRVWADLNQDNDFEDPDELLLSAATNSGSLVSGAITVPGGSLSGTTRLRVSMARDNFPSPCNTGSFSDIEDYGLIIQPGSCDAPAAPVISDIGYASAKADWQTLPNAVAYQLRYRAIGDFSWSATNWVEGPTNYLYNLAPCTDYEVQVRADCGSTFSDFSSSATLATIGCDDPYCYSYGNSRNNWIDRVNVGAINNISGNDHGYANYTHLNTSVQPGNNYPLLLQAQGSSSITTAYWRVWVDFNQDDDFNDGNELVFEGLSGGQGSVNGTLSVPDDGVSAGTTRMRVSMSAGGYGSACSVGGIREVEDYQLTINTPDFLTVTPGSLSLPATGGNAGFNITSNTSWEITENAPWLTASPLSGLANGTITLAATPNNSTNDRSTNIIISGDGVADQIVAVTQTGAPANLSLTPATQVVTAPAGQTTLQVTANVNWAAASNQSWATVTPAAGSGDAALTVAYTENTGSAQRSATITLSSPGQPTQTATVLQNAAAAGPVLMVSPTSQQVGAAAGQTEIEVSSNVSWSVNASQPWATLSMNSGSGSETVAVSYTENTGSTPRSTLVIFSTPGLPPQTATIEQAAGSPSPTLSVTPSSLTVDHEADCVTFAVSSNTSWAASADVSWITSIQPNSGNGDGTVTVCYGENMTSSLRIGNLSFSGAGVSAGASLNQNPEIDTPPWPVTPTGITHTVVLPDTLFSELGGGILSPLDWIGFFYEANGTARCAGVGQWDPNNNTAVTVYGDDPQTPLKDGFDEGEFFSLRVFRSIEQDTVDAQGGYAPIDNVVSHTNRFALDGLSKLDSIYIPPSTAPWTVTVTGDNHSVVIPMGLIGSIDGQPLTTADWIGFFYEDNDTMRCAGMGRWDDQGNTVIPVYGDDAQTPAKDGFGNGEAFIIKVWQTATATEYPAVATYAPTDILITHTDTYANDGVSQIDELDVTLDISLDIALDLGWNTISSYVIPPSLSMEAIFSPVEDEVIIVKDGAGNSYIPAFDINDIGSWDMLQGYQVKMAETEVLTLTGEQIDPQTAIPLAAGWQIVAYLRNTPAPIAAELSGLGNDLLIAKNGAGDTYIPTLNIDDIGNMMPGRGYHLRMTGTDTLAYSLDSFTGSSVDALAGSPDSGHRASLGERAAAERQLTGSNATLIIPKPLAEKWLLPGDQVAVVDATGQRHGLARYDGCHFALTVWGDDPATPAAREGLKAGQPYYLHLWQGGKLSSAAYRPVFESGQLAAYQRDDVQVVQGLERLDWGAGRTGVQVFPNPARDWLTVRHLAKATGLLRYDLLSLSGQRVLTWEARARRPGWQEQQIPLKGLSSGTYFLRIVDGQTIQSRKIIKN